MHIFLYITTSNAVEFDRVHIQGQLKEKIEPGMRFRVRVMQNYANPWWMSYTKSYDIPLDSLGNFELSFLPENKLFYCMFYFQNAQKKMLELSNLPGAVPTWLMSAGDDVKMEISNENISFSGKGSEKLTCQYLINISPIYNENNLMAVNSLVNKNRYKEALDLRINGVEDNLKLNLGILDAFRDEIRDDSIFHILKFDCIGRSYGGLMKIFQRNKFVDYKYDLFKDKLNTVIEVKKDFYGDLAAFSWNYVNYLFEKEFTKCLYFETERDINQGFDYAQMLNQILTIPSGKIRDNVMVASVINLIDQKAEIYNLIPKIKENITTKNGLALFAIWENNNGYQKPAYPFELPDTSGKIHKLADFKGKILIIDFWFNGCFGCMNLNREITPVVELFKNNSKVQFLSINVDKSKKGWLDGLKTGKYTHPGQITLSTFGTSPYDNEMFRFYNYMSLPKLLVIDESGRIVMTNAPDPRIDKGEALVKLIKNILDKS